MMTLVQNQGLHKWSIGAHCQDLEASHCLAQGARHRDQPSHYGHHHHPSHH